MKRLFHSFREETRGRPFVALLGVVYAVIPFFLGFVAVYAVLQRSALATEAHRNCQRSTAIANYIRDAVPKGAKGPGVDRILMLERELRSIGSCPKP